MQQDINNINADVIHNGIIGTEHLNLQKDLYD